MRLSFYYNLLLLILLPTRIHCQSVNCCGDDFSLVKCDGIEASENGDDSYRCLEIGSVEDACVIENWMVDQNAVEQAGITCSYACSKIRSCIGRWAWKAVIIMVSCSLCLMLFTFMCVKIENKRRRKGLTIAQAYIVPLGIPYQRKASRMRKRTLSRQSRDDSGHITGKKFLGRDYVATADGEESSKYSSSLDLPVADPAEESPTGHYANEFIANFNPTYMPPVPWWRTFIPSSLRHGSESSRRSSSLDQSTVGNPYLEI
mmetsp:Transcript_11359/g.16900  ORF Transcript_11359/g.16900 Transcript_11359/m.16900 type:complete len:260 (+) Transcript_11359:123-902(+)